MKEREVTEYRINKNGCECFRTRYREEAYNKLAQLQAKRPGIYTIQSRSYPLNRCGGVDLDNITGQPRWSLWR